MKKPEAILLLKQSEFKQILDYVLDTPTGSEPGKRLVTVLNTLDNLTVVPSQAVPMLEHALRQLATPPPSSPAPSHGANGASSEPPNPQDQV